MSELFINKISKSRQFLFSFILVCSVASLCYVFSGLIGYKVVALILLLAVSLLAISFDIFPVLSAALMSALIWNFFFIPPRFTFHVSNTEDFILFIMYFVIALINAVLTYKIRQIQKVARKKEERANTIKLYNTLLNSLSHELRTWPAVRLHRNRDTFGRNRAACLCQCAVLAHPPAECKPPPPADRGPPVPRTVWRLSLRHRGGRARSIPRAPAAARIRPAGAAQRPCGRDQPASPQGSPGAIRSSARP